VLNRPLESTIFNIIFTLEHMAKRHGKTTKARQEAHRIAKSDVTIEGNSITPAGYRRPSGKLHAPLL